MKKIILSSFLLSCAIGGFAQTNAIEIDLAKRGANVSPDLYGIFLKKSATPAMAGFMPNWYKIADSKSTYFLRV
ncbi:MAG: hypothetical protein IJA00_05470 [Bacteroidaceae bacterium]|nr:hypothetical protein [Bacteroidaceae bacterium]